MICFIRQVSYNLNQLNILLKYETYLTIYPALFNHNNGDETLSDALKRDVT